MPLHPLGQSTANEDTTSKSCVGIQRLNPMAAMMRGVRLVEGCDAARSGATRGRELSLPAEVCRRRVLVSLYYI
jgi:hypothetical protein